MLQFIKLSQIVDNLNITRLQSQGDAPHFLPHKKVLFTSKVL